MRSVKLGIVFATSILISSCDEGSAQDSLPNPVKTCQDVRAYVGAGNSMTMESFKSLLTAAGADLSKGGGKALDMQCKVVPYVKQSVIMSQRVLTKNDGGEIRLTTRVTLDNGVCKLVDLSIDGC